MPERLVLGNNRHAWVRYEFFMLALALAAPGLHGCSGGTSPEWNNDLLPVSGEILFFSNRGGGDTHLYIIGAGGTEALPRLSGEVCVHDARWSHDGEKIAYTVERRYGDADYGYDIYVLERTGKAGWPLITSRSSDREPRWSPQDDRIAFLSDRVQPGCGLYVVNADGSEEQRLIAGEFPDDWGSWSPDGLSVVVAADTAGVMQVVEVATGDTTALVEGYAPAYSPGGEWIAYHNQGIHLIKPDGSEQQTLTNYGDDFCWSPQGSYISFRDRNPYTPYTLEIISVDGAEHAVLVEYEESWRYIRHHSWSPGADYIAFSIPTNLADTESAIFVVDVESGGLQQVTHYPGPERRPEWRPAR